MDRGGDFYYLNGEIQTWLGTVLEGAVTKSGTKITLTQSNGRVFSGRVKRDDEEAFFLRRMA